MRTAFLLILAGCAGAAPQPAQRFARPPPAQPGFADPQERARKLAEALPEMEKLFDDQFKARKMPALVVGLVVDGQLRWSKAWGHQDVARKQPADLDSVFRIASLTKSFTAASVLQLRDAGKLSLDDPVEKHLPELAQIAYPTRDSPRITVRHLLSHGAGFPEDNPWGDLQLGLPEADFQKLLSRGLAFSHAPGTDFEYSN